MCTDVSVSVLLIYLCESAAGGSAAEWSWIRVAFMPLNFPPDIGLLVSSTLALAVTGLS